tara:strand:+ start:127 stop:261 length:135 start_codon:yes stop_codon:yes gene_type:complete
VVRGVAAKATTHPLTIVSFVVSTEEQSLGIVRQENTKDFLKIIM